MEYDPIELLARLVHVNTTGEAGERIPWAQLRICTRNNPVHYVCPDI